MSAPSSSTLPVLDKAQLHALLSTHAGASIALIDTDLRLVHVNTAFASWFDCSPEALVGRALLEVYGEHNHQRYMPHLRRALAGDKVNYERLTVRPDGSEQWYSVSMTPWLDGAGQVVGVVTASLPVHELKATTESLQAANQRLATHMENSPLAVLELDGQLRVVQCSGRAMSLFGWRGPDVLGQPVLEMLRLDAPAQRALTAALRSLQQRDGRNRVQTSHGGSDGHPVHCEWFNSSVTDGAGQVQSIMALIEDVSERVRAAAQLEHMARHDPLTGLPNRAAMVAALEKALARARRCRTAVALLFIDLDAFKPVNDGLGHEAGDAVLVSVAERLRAAVRDTDTVARLGGDEFTVLLDSEVMRDTPQRVAERIVAALAMPFELAQGQARIGASVGVAMHPPLAPDVRLLLSAADTAMYSAKRAGKSCIRYA